MRLGGSGRLLLLLVLGLARLGWQRLLGGRLLGRHLGGRHRLLLLLLLRRRSLLSWLLRSSETLVDIGIIGRVVPVVRWSLRGTTILSSLSIRILLCRVISGTILSGGHGCRSCSGSRKVGRRAAWMIWPLRRRLAGIHESCCLCSFSRGSSRSRARSGA